jgi:hypothetical protein
MTQVQHPVASDDHVGILEHHVAVGKRPEVRRPSAEDDWHDVDRHVVDERPSTPVITSVPFALRSGQSSGKPAANAAGSAAD